MAVAGRNTNVALEDAFWTALKETAAINSISVTRLVSTIDDERQHANLASAMRLYVLGYYRG